MINLARLLGSLLFALLITACGGGGGSAGATNGGNGGGTSTDPVPASIELFASTAQLSSAAGASTTFTVVVKDANNQALPNQTVTFSASSGNLSGALPIPRTGAAGEPVTGVSLTAGTDQSNRNILVTARSGNVSQSITIAVQGTSLSVAGDSAVLSGSNATFTAKALDSSGRPVAGASLTVTSALGNTITPRTTITDSQGAATFSYAGGNAGVDTLTISGLGATAKASISVSSDNFRFESPVAGSGVVVNAAQNVTVRFISGGLPIAGRQVTFSTTRGSVAPASVTTDSEGRASTTVTSATSGPATVLAQVSSAQASLPLVFVANSASSLALQANPGAVPPNAAGSTLNQSALQAVVRDSAGNPVAGQVVNFTAITDGSNGTISPGSGVSDANGTVVAQFIPGALTTANNGVQIRASVQGSAVFGTAALTVSGQALFISIASNNEISNANATTYQKEFSVYVTDANGAPAANRAIVLTVFPDSYAKGALTFTTAAWEYLSFNPCPNEDLLSSDPGLRRNGILDPGEDVNGDGRLNPGLPVVVTPATVTTASNGFATFYLQYGENFANWISTTITARALVGGTESKQTAFYALSASVEDMTNAQVPPASRISPFGTGSCTSPN